MASTCAVWCREEGEEQWRAAVIVRRTETDVTYRLLSPLWDLNDDTEQLYEEKTVSIKPEHFEQRFLMRSVENLTEDGIEDMSNVEFLHEVALLHNLKKRFNRRMVYTNCGTICVSVNPYVWLPIYGERVAAQYKNKNFNEKSVSPHIYSVAEQAYQNLFAQGVSQCVVVSGESGGGKTEATKIVMEYLGNRQTQDVHHRGTVHKVLQTNPLLEAFGNAKTVRNNNSSRFGKFIELHFAVNGFMNGGTIKTYLLEKTRVVHQSIQEGSYHIFYQLLEGASNQELSRLHLLNQSNEPRWDFPYLSNGRINGYVGDVENIDSNNTDHIRVAQFQKTVAAMKTAGLTEIQISSCWNILAAILHMSQIKFEADSSTGELRITEESTNSVEIVCKLLECTSQEAIFALTHRTISTKTDSCAVPLTVPQANNGLMALAKDLYGKLFDFLVQSCNGNLQSENGSCPPVLATPDKSSKRMSCSNQTLHNQGFISILDIFGFECFQINSFEQLCINWANEKLQGLFNRCVLQAVQDEYQEEGVDWSFVDFSDNSECIDLLEGKVGVVALLNEECVVPGGSETSFNRKLNTMHEKHPHLEKPKLQKGGQQVFAIKHYAGTVSYQVDGFLEKNKDTLQQDLVSVMERSESDLIRVLYSTTANKNATNQQNNKISPNAPRTRQSIAPNNRSPNKRPPKRDILSSTVSSQFKSHLNSLMKVISASAIHFIRCIKPNDQQQPGVFDTNRVSHQLRYAGVLEAIKIGRSLYPHQMTHQQCWNRFRMLLPSASLPAASQPLADERDLCSLLFSHLFSESFGNKIQIGLTKIYFRPGVLDYLERQRLETFSFVVVKCQRAFRRWSCMRRYATLKRATVTIQAHTRMYIAKRRFNRLVSSVLLLQCLWRGKVARKELADKRRRYRAVQIQKFVRGRSVLVQFKRYKAAATMIQSRVRSYLTRRWYLKSIAEFKEQSKMSNQLELMRRQLEMEMEARRHVESERDQLNQQLTLFDEAIQYTSRVKQEIEDSRRRHAEETEAKQKHQTLKQEYDNLDLCVQLERQLRKEAETAIGRMQTEMEELRQWRQTHGNKFRQMQYALKQLITDLKSSQAENKSLKEENTRLKDELTDVKQVLAMEVQVRVKLEDMYSTTGATVTPSTVESIDRSMFSTVRFERNFNNSPSLKIDSRVSPVKNDLSKTKSPAVAVKNRPVTVQGDRHIDGHASAEILSSNLNQVRPDHRFDWESEKDNATRRRSKRVNEKLKSEFKDDRNENLNLDYEIPDPIQAMKSHVGSFWKRSSNKEKSAKNSKSGGGLSFTQTLRNLLG
eukprot:GILK01006914.1.p1 GENE.GILK01006914.1~~GILK01006914.1.p1  ORF type:complete len:1308 (-),score=307.14 GILK01006914.1:165-4088(-)